MQAGMAFFPTRSGCVLFLVLVAGNLESSPAFSNAPSQSLFRVQMPRKLDRRGPTCRVGHDHAAASKTQQLYTESMPSNGAISFSQRIYPVHPDDLSPEQRRVNLMKMVLAVGMRDMLLGMAAASFVFVTSSGFDSPDYHFPVVTWLFYCLVGRVMQDDLGPLAFDMQHIQVPHPPMPSFIPHTNSFADWRDATISPKDIEQPQRLGPRSAPSSNPRLKLGAGTQRIITNFATQAELAPPPVVSGPNTDSFPLQVVRGFSVIVFNIFSDLFDALSWVFHPHANVPENEEPGPEDLWDCRDPDTPIEPGL